MMLSSTSVDDIEIPGCPSCGGRYWTTTQRADCSRTITLSRSFGATSASIGFWNEAGDSDGQGNGGNFRQDDWTCRACGYVAVDIDIDAAWEAARA